MSDRDGCPQKGAETLPLAGPLIDRTVTLPGGLPAVASALPDIEGYEVLEEVGRGGMGVVYRARQRAAGGRVVALKVMLGEAFASAADLRRFEREVEIAADLNHANIAHIYDSGLVQGRHFFAMEYVKGQALDVFCKTRDLPVKGRLRLFAAVCEAVAFAHRRGVIHRDLKPSNILVDDEGVPHVLDFGLAKVQTAAGEVAVSRPELTMDGMLLGTLPYMAPEQADGKVSAIDTRTDVYALGVILYQLLTGKYPYEVTGQMADVLKRIAEEEPRRPSTVNRLIGDEVETIILRALHKLPDRRYSGADDFARDVTHFLAGEPIEAKRDSGLYVLRKTMRRYRVPLSFAATIVLLLAASAVSSFRLYRRAQVEKQQAEQQRNLAETSRRQESAAKVLAEESQHHAEKQRALAQTSEKESTRRLARLHFNEGVNRWFERLDAASAAACFAEALRVCPEPFPAARLALNNALQECPQMCFPPFHTSAGKVGSVLTGIAAFSPDGKRFITAPDYTTARVWDAISGIPVSALMHHDEGIFSVTFSSDGRWVLISAMTRRGSAGWAARVWDATTGHPVSAPMQNNTNHVSAAFSPDGKWVLTASDDLSARVWDAATGQPVSAPMQHNGRRVRAAFSPDGKWVLTASDDKTAQVWDTATGQPVSAPMQHAKLIDIASFSPDGKWVLTASDDLFARVWDAATGQPVSNPMQHNSRRVSAAFSPNGKWVFTASDPKTAQVWDAATGQPVSAPMQHGEWIRTAAFSPDGKWILTAAEGGSARVWDAATGQPVSTPMRLPQRVNAEIAAFCPDGKWILAASDDKTVRVWDVATGQPVSAPMQHGEWVRTAAFSPDGKWILTANEYGSARVWNAVTGHPVFPPMQQGTNASIRVAAFRPDGRRVFTASNDKTSRVRDADTGQSVFASIQHGERISSVTFSLDGKWVLAASDDKTARVWDAITGKPVSAPMQHDERILSVTFSSDGKRVLTASDDLFARVWDAITGNPVSAPMQHGERIFRQTNGKRVFAAQSASILSGEMIPRVTFSPDDKWVLTAWDDSGTLNGTATGGHFARVWDATTGQPVSAPMQHDQRIYNATFSSDGRRVLTASSDLTARVWDAATGQPASTTRMGSGGFGYFDASFSPDGKRVLTAVMYSSLPWEGDCRVWDATTGQLVCTLMQQREAIQCAAFSPNGKWILIASMDHAVRVWDATTGDPVSASMQHGDRVTTAAFSPDGRWVVTASQDKTSRLWEATTGQPVSAPLQHESWVRNPTATFSPDGKWVVTAASSGYGTARVWRVADLDWEEPIGLVQARVRARLGLAVDSSGNVQCLSAEELAAAWKDYERLRADYERTGSSSSAAPADGAKTNCIAVAGSTPMPR